MKIAVFSRTDSAVLRRAPSIEARTDRAACREAQEYQRMVVEMLREEYGDDFIGTPPSDGSGGECNKRGEGVRMCHHFEAEALQIDTDNKVMKETSSIFILQKKSLTKPRSACLKKVSY